MELGHDLREEEEAKCHEGHGVGGERAGLRAVHRLAVDEQLRVVREPRLDQHDGALEEVTLRGRAEVGGGGSPRPSRGARRGGGRGGSIARRHRHRGAERDHLIRLVDDAHRVDARRHVGRDVDGDVIDDEADELDIGVDEGNAAHDEGEPTSIVPEP